MGSVLITSLLTLQLVFSSPFIGQATDTPRLRGQELREQAQLRNEEKRATIAARFTEIRRQRITNFFNRLIKRLESAIARLEKLIERIESRIAKIEEEEEDLATGPITEQVNEAKAMLADAKADLEATKDNFEALLDSDEPKEVFNEVRGNIIDIKDALVEVHRILVNVIGDIKGLRVGTTGSPGVSPTP